MDYLMTSSDVLAVNQCFFVVSIQQKVNGKIKLCGGTVLTETLTLTAAHCVMFGIIGLYLQFGSTFLFGGRHFEATQIKIHPDFDEIKLNNDIGIVTVFPAKVEFGINALPVKLVKEIDTIDTKLVVFGWGAISEHKSFSEILLAAAMPLVEQEFCRFLLENVPQNTFCLGYLDGHVDACLGDSGGPAMLRDVQIGITSFGEGCALPMKPGVYTDVRKYLKWIYNIQATFV